MAGLSNFIANQATQETTMPSWYDQAQQNVVNMATSGAQNVPTLGQTVAGGAIQQLQGPQNPFTQAQSTLNQIATGAANPWITSPTGEVTPNIATPLGGLFQAQNQQLRQLAPDIMAAPTAAGTATGQFGSLRTQTAADKALADAQAKLFADQMQAALQSQQIGTQAATGLGQVGSQGVTSMTNLGQAQQADPLLAASALGKVLGSLQVPTTTKNVTQLSPLNQIGSIASALGGSISGTDALLKKLFPAIGTPGQPGYKPAQGLGSLLQKMIGGGSPGGSGYYAGQTGFPAGPGAPAEVQDASGNVKEGYFQDEEGNWYGPGSNMPISGPDAVIDTGGGGDNTGGDNVDWTGGGGVIDTGTGEDWNMG